MKRFLAVLLTAVLLCLQPAAFAENQTAQMDTAAMTEFVESWNRFLAEAGKPVMLAMEQSEENIYLEVYAYPTAEVGAAVPAGELLTYPGQYGALMTGYASGEDCFFLMLDGTYLLDTIQSMTLQVGNESWPAAVQHYPAGAGLATDTYYITFPYDPVAKGMAADRFALRIGTGLGEQVLEFSGEKTSELAGMLYFSYLGVGYSHRQDSDYLNRALLSDEKMMVYAAVQPTEAPAQPAPPEEEADPAAALPVLPSQPEGGAAPTDAPPVQPAQAGSEAFQTDYEAIEAAAKSVFLLEAYDENNEVLSTGSGFLAFDGETLITNHHVIEGAANMIAYSDNYENMYVVSELMAASEERDIAILRFDNQEGIPPLPVDSGSSVLRGQPVTAIGSPQGVLNTVSSGNVSNILYLTEAWPDVIQFTAAISHGSSGGALFNQNGSVVGLVFGLLEDGENMNYAVPIKYVEELYRQAQGRAPMLLAAFNRLEGQLPAIALQAPKQLDGGVQLAWLPVEGAEEYRVYRKPHGSKDFQIIATTTATTCIDTDVELGEGYTYYVEAVHSWMLPSVSNQAVINVKEPTPVPTAVPTPEPTATPVPQGQLHLVEGDRGEDVLSLRLMLFELGYHGEDWLDEESYDSQLKSIVNMFQENHHLQATGMVDEHTLAMLESGEALPGHLTVSAELKALSRRHYQEGDEGQEISRLKGRMKKLGYYRPDAEYDGTYNATMTSRVKQLQTNNGLEATGVLDHRTLVELYSDGCKTGQWYTPPEAAGVKLVIPDNAYAQWDYLNGDILKFRLQVKNTSKTKTVTSYEIYLYPVDSRGNRLIGSKQAYIISGDENIKPGKTVYTPYVKMADSDRIAEVYAAVHKVKYTDGSTDTVAYHDYDCWEID